MFRVLLAGLLLLAIPAIVMAQEKKGNDGPPPAVTQGDAGGEMWIQTTPMWQRFVLIFVVALLVLIVIQIMMLRADINTMIDRITGVGGPPIKR